VQFIIYKVPLPASLT